MNSALTNSNMFVHSGSVHFNKIVTYVHKITYITLVRKNKWKANQYHAGFIISPCPFMFKGLMAPFLSFLILQGTPPESHAVNEVVTSETSYVYNSREFQINPFYI